MSLIYHTAVVSHQQSIGLSSKWEIKEDRARSAYTIPRTNCLLEGEIVYKTTLRQLDYHKSWDVGGLKGGHRRLYTAHKQFYCIEYSRCFRYNRYPSQYSYSTSIQNYCSIASNMGDPSSNPSRVYSKNLTNYSEPLWLSSLVLVLRYRGASPRFESIVKSVSIRDDGNRLGNNLFTTYYVWKWHSTSYTLK